QAKIGEQAVERTALASVMTTIVNAADNQLLPPPSRLSRQVWLAVRPGPAPFVLTASAPEAVVRGKKLPIKVAVERTEACKRKGTLTALKLPNGWKMPAAEIAAGAKEITVELDVPANAGPDVYTFALRGDAQAAVGEPKKEVAVALPTNLLKV